MDFAEQLKTGIDRPVLDPDKFSDLEIDHSAWSGTQPQAKAGEWRPSWKALNISRLVRRLDAESSVGILLSYLITRS